MELFDFTEIQQNERVYEGMSGHKKGVTVNGKNYILKFPKREDKERMNTSLSYSTCPLSEYIGSHIYALIGIPVHNTFLAQCDGKLVCACEDFRARGDELLSFTGYKVTFSPHFLDSSGNETSGAGTDLTDVLQTIENHPLLQNVKGVKERFWNMFVVDALIGNTDRNNGNWGVLLKFNGEKNLSPVYDNGNSFFHNWDDAKMERQIHNGILSDDVVYKSRVCIFSRNDKRVNPYHIIQRHEYADCDRAVTRLTPTIIKQLPTMRSLINGIPEQADGLDIISPTKKLFFTSILQERVSRVLLPTYKQLQLDNNITLDTADESGKSLLDRLISTAVKHRRSMGLKESIDAACREIIGNDRTQAVIRKDKMVGYLESIGKSGIMEYVTKQVKNASMKKEQHRSREGDMKGRG